MNERHGYFLEGQKVKSLSKDLNLIASKVSRECGGLPIAIVIVGRALMKIEAKTLRIDATRQLQNPVQTKIKGMESYDNDIPKEALVRYRIGLGLFQEVDIIEDARHRALAIVNTLVSSFMLLEVYGKIKMHDVVQDVAIHIACKEENRHIVKAVPNADMFPDDLRFEKLVSFDIRIGKRGSVYQESFEKTLRLIYGTRLSRSVKVLLKRTEFLQLKDCEGLKNILEDLDSNSFGQLKSLKLEECNEMKYLLDIIDGAPRVLAPFCNLVELELWHLGNFSEICHGQLPAVSFSNLRSVRFTSSGPLKLLFPPSLVQGLVHLQSLSFFAEI
ncbi:putative disease resistance protein [Camellia lanceoleosa]|uniref:Disease resistance protein n=1 Tax=Camellia lanceoleosa TaxID=1840588 RepID=A0ACC0F4X4_9ERIC|nr:putative disease resistance protein [Camellia lanceoleosa]